MGETLGKEAILGRLRDEGFTAVLVNRVAELLSVFNDNIPQFAAATKGQLNAAYAKLHPEPKQKNLGERTYDVFDRFVRIWKESRFEARQVAKAAVEEQERREAERAAMREELLDRKVDFDALTSAMAALGTLGVKECAIGKLLEMYEMAKAAKGPSDGLL